MYQFALVQMLHNTKTDTFHPIYYYDSPMAGGFGERTLNNDIIRYKSKGHHTAGFTDRVDAIKSVDELVVKLKEMHDTVTVEIDTDLIWDGEDIPTDHQLRPYPIVKTN